MTETANVNLDEVRRVAELANLELTASELPGMQNDLNAILGHIAQLNELDTRGVPPMAQVSEVLGGREHRGQAAGIQVAGIPAEGNGAALRQDALRPSLDRAPVMAAAPETNGSFFKVPKVIER